MRAARRVLVTVLVLAGLLLAVDRVAAWAAQRTVADQVAEELATYQVDSEPPEVTVGGFPFLTQVAAGRYEEVTLRLRDVGSGALRLPMVELTATGVVAPASAVIDGEGEIRAAEVVGAATIGYAQVRGLTGREELRLRGEGGVLMVELPVERSGAQVTLAGTAGVEAAGDVVRVRVRELSVQEGSDLPPGADALAAQLAQELSVDVPLPPLPYGLAVESVRADVDGLVVTVSARDVPLSR